MLLLIELHGKNVGQLSCGLLKNAHLVEKILTNLLEYTQW